MELLLSLKGFEHRCVFFIRNKIKIHFISDTSKNVSQTATDEAENAENANLCTILAIPQVSGIPPLSIKQKRRKGANKPRFKKLYNIRNS